MQWLDRNEAHAARARTNILTAISSTKAFTARFYSSFKFWYRSDAKASSIKTSSPFAMSSEGWTSYSVSRIISLGTRRVLLITWKDAAIWLDATRSCRQHNSVYATIPDPSPSWKGLVRQTNYVYGTYGSMIWRMLGFWCVDYNHRNLLWQSFVEIRIATDRSHRDWQFDHTQTPIIND